LPTFSMDLNRCIHLLLVMKKQIKYTDIGFGIQIKKIKRKSDLSDVKLNNYEIKNILTKKRKK